MSATPDRIVIRERLEADLPALERLLGEQQETSHYPFRWPLPFPAREFLVRTYEERAWVVELDGDVAGHVMLGRVERPEPFLASGRIAPDARLATVSVLFTGLAARGLGLGGLLLDTAVATARAAGRVPVLDVVPTHSTALAVYRHRGWTVVGRSRYDWLPDDVDDCYLMALI